MAVVFPMIKLRLWFIRHVAMQKLLAISTSFL